MRRGLTKLKKVQKKIEEKANNFLKKNFPEEREEYTSYGLLNKTKNNFNGIFANKMLVRAKELHSNTTHFYRSLNEDITFSDIQELEEPKYNNLAQPQYKITIKGITEGQDDYNCSTVTIKFDVCVIIDKYSDYIIDSICVRERW